MKHTNRPILPALLALAAQFGTPQAQAQEAGAAAAPAPELRYSDKWRLQVSEGANSDGTMTFYAMARTSRSSSSSPP